LGTATKEAGPVISESAIVKIYPNPVSNILNINLLGIFNKQSYIQIVDAKGSVVIEQKAMNNPQAIDVSKLAKGIYLVKINNGGSYITSKFVKE
jgi:hypothetical protein